MGIEKAKEILDRALRICIIYRYKDWDAESVEELIEEVKSALNEAKS